MASGFGFFPELLGHGRPSHRTRTWDDGDVHFTQEERSYTSPHLAYVTMSRTAGAPVEDNSSSRASHRRGRSLLGKVFGGIADYVASDPQRGGARRRAERQQPFIEDLAYGEDWRDNGGTSTKRGSTFEEDYGRSNCTRSPRNVRLRRHRRQHSPSPPRRSRSFEHGYTPNGRSDFFDCASSSGSDAHDYSGADDTGRAKEYEDLLTALENAAESHRIEARLARRQLEHACRQPIGNAGYLQNLARKVKTHEQARDNALRDLDQARADAEEMQHQDRQSRPPRPSRRHTSASHFEGDGLINDPFLETFFSFPRRQSSNHPLFARAAAMGSQSPFGPSPFSAFDHLFADFDNINRMHHNMHSQFFGMPGASFTASFGTPPRPTDYSHRRRRGPQRQQSAGFASSQQPSGPPATLLKPEEAKRLYASYNDRWNGISPSEPNVPFPARGLTPAGLCSRSALWAPSVSSPIDAWSEETVMKANAQSFFLGAVGMRPEYSELPGGKIELGVDKASGSPAQAQQLIDILKRERIRWHSDRLGKRNGGRAGLNEALQGDERARAVYHAVCELIQAVQ